MQRNIIPLIACLVACSSAQKPVAVTPAVFNVELRPTSDPALGADSVMSIGCLPDQSDSSEFTLAIILETPSPVDGSFTVAFNDRTVPPNVQYPNVSVSLYPYGTRRVTSTSCSKSGGMVMRASLKRLWLATISADPPGVLKVEVYTAGGHSLASKRLTRTSRPQTITWIAPPAT